MTRHDARNGALLLLGAAWLAAACGRQNADDGDDSTVPPVATVADSSGGDADAGSLSAANVTSLVAALNGAEIAAARVAERKATSADVKSLARQIITDHEAMQRSVDSLAKAKNIVPQSPPREDYMLERSRATMARLDSASGHAFDSVYVETQVLAHSRALNDLPGFAAAAGDPDLRALIDSSLTKIRQHLDRATELQSRSDRS